MAIEPKRGCGYRQVGGLYLVPVPDDDKDHNPKAGIDSSP